MLPAMYRAALTLASVLIPLSLTAAPQNAGLTPDQSQVADALKRVENDDLGQGPVDALSVVDVIAAARSPRAIPILEQYFSRTSDPQIKAGVASALVRMGDRDGDYWPYLVKLATLAVESAAPWPLEQMAGNEKPSISSEFTVWANSQNLSVESAMNVAMLDLPGNLAPLARTGDPRGIPLLRKALTSPNGLIVTLGAAGLAQAQDLTSIPLIIDACKQVSAIFAPGVANALLFFNDPRAQKAFAFYCPNVNAGEARKFNGFSPFGPRYTIQR